MIPGTCFVCSAQARYHPVTGDNYGVECPRCGSYGISGTATALLERYPGFDGQGRLGLERAKLSGWIRERTDLGDPPKITGYDLDGIAALPLPPMLARAERLLLKVIGRTPGLGFGATGRYDDPELVATVYGRSEGDVRGFGDLLKERKWIETPFGVGALRVSAEGLLHAEELRYLVRPSRVGFVAMWFAEDMRATFDDGLAPAIRSAGYEPRRVDDIEHTGKIDDRILAEIRASRFVVADFTGHRGGVYFEAGFALGLNLPVIWTCRKGDIEALHFDARQYAFIDWKDLDDLKLRLQRRIEAVLGKGPLQEAAA